MPLWLLVKGKSELNQSRCDDCVLLRRAESSRLSCEVCSGRLRFSPHHHFSLVSLCINGAVHGSVTCRLVLVSSYSIIALKLLFTSMQPKHLIRFVKCVIR